MRILGSTSLSNHSILCFWGLGKSVSEVPPYLYPLGLHWQSLSQGNANPQMDGGTRKLPVHPQSLTLADFFTVSALLSLLEVLAALGEFRPLDRRSSLMGEARPSGLAGCFFRPLRSVDICPPKAKDG